MSSQTKEGAGAKDCMDAFVELSGGADYITEAQMRSVFEPSQVDYLLTKLPKIDADKYDYKAFVSSTFTQ